MLCRISRKSALVWVNYSIGWIFGVRGIKKPIFLVREPIFDFFMAGNGKFRPRSTFCRRFRSKRPTKVTKTSPNRRILPSDRRNRRKTVLSVTSGEYFGQNPHQHVGLALKFMFPASKYKTIGSRIKKSRFLHPKPRISNLYYN